MELTNSSLHHTILKSLVDRGYAPSAAELASHFACSIERMSAALRALADDHGVVLHPHSPEVWVIHPFSNAPTGFLVKSGQQQWWGNCAWCSLGVAHLVGGSATITATLGADSEQVSLRFRNGVLLDPDYVVHFPIPMTEAWDNVIYTCSMMLLFRSEAAVDEWCRKHGKPKGDVRPLEQIWRFSQDWYGRHLDPGWRKWTTAEAAALFARHGLEADPSGNCQ